MKNNYDTCSTMEDCELHLFFDCDASRMDFEDNFHVVQHAGHYSRTACYFFTGCEEIDCPQSVSDCLDLSRCNEKDFRAYCWENHDRSFRDLVEEKNQCGSWKDLAMETMDWDSLPTAMRDGFPFINNAKELYEVSTATGSSQGDYALILYSPDGWGENVDFHEMFSNYLYSAPIYGVLEVEGLEYRLEEAFSDTYSYDKEELIKYVGKLGLSESVVQWVTENAPEYPSYI